MNYSPLFAEGSTTFKIENIEKFKQVNSVTMKYLHITTDTETNIGVLQLGELEMVVPKVDSKIRKVIESKLPKMIEEHFNADFGTILSITIYDRSPLKIEIRVDLNENDDDFRLYHHVFYANETWVY